MGHGSIRSRIAIHQPPANPAEPASRNFLRSMLTLPIPIPLSYSGWTRMTEWLLITLV